VFLKSLDTDDGIASRRAYLVFQEARVLSGLEHHLGGSHNCLSGEVLRRLARESLGYSAVSESFDNEVELSRSRTGKAARGIDEVLWHPFDYAECFEKLLREFFFFRGEVSTGIQSERAHAYQGRGVRH